MPYIGNITSDFSIDTGNITNRAVTATKLSPSSVGSNGQVLSVDGSGNLQWGNDANAPEGTAVLSTGVGTITKYLRVDGDGTCSWQTVDYINVIAQNNVAATVYPLFAGNGATSTGPLTPATDTGFTYNSSSGALTATSFVGALTGTASGNAVLTGSTNNQLVTVTGANAITGESTLLWDGSAFSTYRDNATTYGPGIIGHHQRGTIASPSVSQTDDTLLNIVAKGFDGTDYHDAARIDFVSGAGTPGNNDMPGSILFKTTDDGTGSSVTRLTIAQSGVIKLDDSATLLIPDAIQHTGDTNTQIRFPSADTIHLETGGTNRLKIDANGVVQITRRLELTNTGDNHYVYEGRSWTWSSNGVSTGTIRAYAYGDSSGNLRIGTNGWNERLQISSTGQILSGTTSSNSSDANAIFAGGGNSGTGDYGKIYISGNYTNPAADQAVGFVGFSINSLSNHAFAYIGVYTDGAHSGSSDTPSRMSFHTTPDGSGTPYERLSIKNDGNFEIKSATSTTGEQLGRFEWWNENSAGIMAKISCVREASSQAPGALTFYTSPNVDSTDNGGEGSWAERLRIRSDGRICIGSTNVGSGSADDLNIENTSDHGGMTIRTPNNKWGSIHFADGGTGDELYRGQVSYDHGNDWMRFYSGGSSGGECFRIKGNRDIDVVGGNIAFSVAGKGISFAATSDAGGVASELLDDYEEGTWTPVLGGGSPTFSANNNKGYYIKIGRLVHISIQIDVVVTGAGSGNFTITGLPYAAGNDMGGHGQALSVGPMYDWDYPANIVQLGPRMNDNSSEIKIWVNYDDAADSILGWPLGSSGAKYGSIAGTYVAA